jgi:hypothetical protein
VELLNLKGTWDAQGKFIISPGKYISCAALADLDKLPLLEGTPVNLIITFDARELIRGRDGIVWATKHLLQAEIICNALTAQNFSVQILNKQLADGPIYLLQSSSHKEVPDLIDFIWKGENGLQLKPDWAYGDEEPNKSFEKWVNG